MADALIIALRVDGYAQALAKMNGIGRAVGNLGRAQNAVVRRAQSRGGALVGPFSNPAAKRGMPPSFGNRLNTFIRSTRFGYGTGMPFHPLVGRTMDLLGPLKSIPGPLKVLAVTLMSAGVAAKLAAERLTEVGNLKAVTGGTTSETLAARNLSQFLGMDAASAAKSVAEQLASSGWAQMAGIPRGISDPMGNTPRGAADRLKNLLKIAETIATMPDPIGAQQFARSFGDIGEKMLELRNLKPETLKRLLASQSEAFSDSRIRAAAEFNAEMAILQNRLADMKTLMAPAIGFVNYLLKSFTDIFDPNMPSPFDTPQQAGAKLARRQQAQRDAKDRAQRENTDALNGLSTTLRGLFQGGERARGAIPRGMAGQFGHPGGMRDSINLGAFTL